MGTVPRLEEKNASRATTKEGWLSQGQPYTEMRCCVSEDVGFDLWGSLFMAGEAMEKRI